MAQAAPARALLFIEAEQAVQLQQENEPIAEFGDAAQILSVVSGRHFGRGLYRIEGQEQDLGNAVDDQADTRGGALGDHDAGLLGRICRGHPEPASKVDDGDDPAAQVDHALHEAGCPWHRRDRLIADDFEDSRDVQTVVLVRKLADHDLQLCGPTAAAGRWLVGHGASLLC
jgi:hypothetical protein